MPQGHSGDVSERSPTGTLDSSIRTRTRPFKGPKDLLKGQQIYSTRERVPEFYAYIISQRDIYSRFST